MEENPQSSSSDAQGNWREQEPTGLAMQISLKKCQESQWSGSLSLISALRDDALALLEQPTTRARASDKTLASVLELIVMNTIMI